MSRAVVYIILLFAPCPVSDPLQWTMCITFHVKKYTVTIIIAETHQKDRSEKNDRHLCKK